MTSTMGYAGGHNFGDPHNIGGGNASGPAAAGKKGPGPSGIADPRCSIAEAEHAARDRYVIVTAVWERWRHTKEAMRRAAIRRAALSKAAGTDQQILPLGRSLSSQELAPRLTFNRNFWREKRQGKSPREQEDLKKIEKRYGNLISAASQVLQNNHGGVITVDLTDFAEDVRNQFLAELTAMRLHYYYFPETIKKLPPYDRCRAVVEIGIDLKAWARLA